MTLKSRLALLNVQVPERPDLFCSGLTLNPSVPYDFEQYAISLELACAHLAGEVERLRANKPLAEGDSACSECEGWGRSRCDSCYSLDRICTWCSGTGVRP